MYIEKNPIIQNSTYKHGAIPFNAIKLEHFIPALDFAIEGAKNKLEEVKKNPEPPSAFRIVGCRHPPKKPSGKENQQIQRKV